METGKDEAGLVFQILARKGRLDTDALGQKFINAPEVREWEALYWRAYWELASCRPYALAPIAWTHIRLWAAAHDLTPLEERELGMLCRELDMVYLPHRDRQLAAARERERQDALRNGHR